jgi:hypothetical protein
MVDEESGCAQVFSDVNNLFICICSTEPRDAGDDLRFPNLALPLIPGVWSSRVETTIDRKMFRGASYDAVRRSFGGFGAPMRPPLWDIRRNSRSGLVEDVLTLAVQLH